MDAFELISNSEWPAVAAVALFMIRKPLGQMIDRISPTKVDAWGFKAEFEKKLDAVELLAAPTEADDDKESGQDIAAQLEPDIDPPPVSAVGEENAQPIAAKDDPTPPSDLLDSISQLASGDDAAGLESALIVMNAWKHLQGAMFAINPVSSLWLTSTDGATVNRWKQSARELGLTPNQGAAVRELRNLKNKLVNSDGEKITPQDAARYRAAVDSLIKTMVERRRTNFTAGPTTAS